MDRQIIGVQVPLQAFNEAVRILQELPYRTVADVMVLLRQNQPVYAPEEKVVDTLPSKPVKSKATRNGPRAIANGAAP